MRLLHVLIGAWHRSIRPARNGAHVIVVQPGWAGCYGRVFNPSPLPDGRWVIHLAVDAGSRYSPDGDAFAKLYRWEFVTI